MLGLGSLISYSDGFTVPEVSFLHSGGVSKSNCSVYRGQLYSILIDGVMISVKNEGAHSYVISSFLRILYLQNDLSEPFELEY